MWDTPKTSRSCLCLNEGVQIFVLWNFLFSFKFVNELEIINLQRLFCFLLFSLTFYLMSVELKLRTESSVVVLSVDESFFSSHRVCVGNLKEPDGFYVYQRYISEMYATRSLTFFLSLLVDQTAVQQLCAQMWENVCVRREKGVFVSACVSESEG